MIPITVNLQSEQCTNGKIRLVGGSIPSEGRVEMCYNQQWGTMCGYNSISTFSNVICRQLGYSPYNANVYQNSYYGQGNAGIFLYTPSLLCIGNERTLLDCYHAPVGYHRCNDHSSDLGIQCQGKCTMFFRVRFKNLNSAPVVSYPNISACKSGSMRLIGGDYAFQGTVEICIGGTWNTICGYPSGWNETNSIVLCNQLGINTTSMCVQIMINSCSDNFCFISDVTTYYNSYFGQGHGYALQLQAACTGNEYSIFICPPYQPEFYFQQYSYRCYDHNQDIGIHCITDTGRPT